MAGIGIKLNKIYEKRTVTTNLLGIGYSAVITIAPMFLIILSIIAMQYLLDGFFLGYSTRLVFACSVLYIFIFALLTTSPFNAVLSKYLSDVIYRETYEDILPCYYMGLALNAVLSCIPAIPFCLWAYFVGELSLPYVFAVYCGYMLLVQILYAMLYLSICKDYGKISLFYLLGAIVAVLMSWIFAKKLGWDTELAMMAALDIGFLVTACLEIGMIRGYFRQNSGKYKEVLGYLLKYWKLIVTNFLYILGLYIHNFVFWTTDLHIVVSNTFVCVLPYDMATCIAMFTNISATVIFISRMERYFHERYKNYSEAVIGGKWKDIVNAKNRMFNQLSEELMSLLRLQFIVSAIVYLLAVMFLPQYGYAGLVMRIYPCMAAGYFILFIMYAAIIYLYYFEDLTGALMTSLSFCITTFVVSIFATEFADIWYGLGITAGSFVGWTVAYIRLRWLEKHFDVHIFCNGHILKKGRGKRPDSMVYEKKENGDTKKDEKEAIICN